MKQLCIYIKNKIKATWCVVTRHHFERKKQVVYICWLVWDFAKHVLWTYIKNSKKITKFRTDGNLCGVLEIIWTIIAHMGISPPRTTSREKLEIHTREIKDWMLTNNKIMFRFSDNRINHSRSEKMRCWGIAVSSCDVSIKKRCLCRHPVPDKLADILLDAEFKKGLG